MLVRVFVQCVLQIALLSVISLFLFGCGITNQQAMPNNTGSASATIGVSGSIGPGSGGGTGAGGVGSGGGGTGSGGGSGTGSGSSSSGDQLIFALSADNRPHLNVFDFNPNTGTLTQIGSADDPIGGAGGITIDSAFNVLFMQNDNDLCCLQPGDNLAIFDISDPLSPRLLRTQAIGGNHAPAGRIVVDTSGRFPILLSDGGEFESLEYDSVTGTMVEHSDWQKAGPNPALVILDPTQKLVTAINNDAQIHVSSRNPETGMLSPLADPFTVNGVVFPGLPVFSPDGKYYIFPDWIKGVVYSYAVDLNTGNLNLASRSNCNAGNFYGFLNATTLLGSEAAQTKSLRLFKYDPASGAVTPTGIGVNLAGDTTTSVNISAGGRLIYAANAAGNQIPTLQIVRFDPLANTLTVVTPLNSPKVMNPAIESRSK